MQNVIKRYDLAIVGSGFAGSLMAMIARKLELSVVLLEKFRHPRFAIGESATPLANLLLEELASRYDLPRLRPLTKFGSWQDAYPDIACGLKRGFTFLHHRFGQSFKDDSSRSNQLLVAASPHDRIADTHWYRPEFDRFLVNEAQRAGVDYFDEVLLDVPTFSQGKVKLTGKRDSKAVSFTSRFLVDATGPRGFLHRTMKLSEVPFRYLPATQGLYTHFTGVRRLEEMSSTASSEIPPFPIDDAAVHHVFEGGWIWVLRFNNGITSAGVAAVDDMAEQLRFREGAPAWELLLKQLPTVAQQFEDARPQLPFVHAPRISFHSAEIIGEHWALLPSAAGVIDPLLSTGFPLVLLGISRLAEALRHGLGSQRFRDHLQSYAAETRNELVATERLVGALYANMKDFELFTSLSFIYFAAVSFAEAARRLGRPELASSFLLNDDSDFGPHSRSCLEQALKCLNVLEKEKLVKEIEQTIEPINVAGLARIDRHSWYPVYASDLLSAAHKLRATKQEVEQFLKRSGFLTTT